MGAVLVLIVDLPGRGDNSQFGESLILGGAIAHSLPDPKHGLGQLRAVHPHTYRSAQTGFITGAGADVGVEGVTTSGVEFPSLHLRQSGERLLENIAGDIVCA